MLDLKEILNLDYKRDKQLPKSGVLTTWFYDNLIPKSIDGNLEWRDMVMRLAVDQPEIGEILRWACSCDMLFWVNTFVWTLNPKDHQQCPIRPFVTFPFQDKTLLFLQQWIGKQDIAIVKSRDMGASWMCLLAMAHHWQFRRQQQFLLTSETEELVDSPSEKALFKKLDFIWQRMPLCVQPDLERLKKSAFCRETGSRFTGQATVENLGRGDRPTAVMLDEAAMMHNAGAIDAGTVGATNCRLFNSTPNGRFGTGKAFFERCQNPATQKLFLHWSEHPAKNEGLYKLRRRLAVPPENSGLNPGDLISELKMLELRRKYGAEFDASEIVKVDLDPLTYNWLDDYDIERMRFREGEVPRSKWYDWQCERQKNDPLVIARELNLDFEGSSEKLASGNVIETVRSTMCTRAVYRGEVFPTEESLREGVENLRPKWVAGGGNLDVWCDLNGGKPPRDSYTIGVDVSGGAGGASSSETVFSVWSATKGIQCAEWRSNCVEPREAALKCVVLAKWFYNAFIVPECNGPGGTTFVKRVLSCQYYEMWRRTKGEQEVQVWASDTSKYGWHSSKGPEGPLRALLAALSHEEATLKSDVAARQLEEYEWQGGKIIHRASERNNAQSDKGQSHGDAAVAAALAWMGVEHKGLLDIDDEELHDEAVPDEPPMNSVAWRRRERQRIAERAEDYVTEW